MQATLNKNGRTYTILTEVSSEPLTKGRGFFTEMDITPMESNDEEAMLECQRLSYQMFPGHVPGQTDASVQRSPISHKWIAQCHMALREGDTVNLHRNFHEIMGTWKLEDGELRQAE